MAQYIKDETPVRMKWSGLLRSFHVQIPFSYTKSPRCVNSFKGNKVGVPSSVYFVFSLVFVLKSLKGWERGRREGNPCDIVRCRLDIFVSLLID